MENYTNDPIDTIALQRFEEVILTPLQPSYLKIVWLNLSMIFVVIAAIAGSAIYFIEELTPNWPIVVVIYVVIAAFSALLSMVNFRNKGFAFRTHDAIYRSGAIGITTTIIPYNRVQHVALHEGFIARKLGLAEIEIFTAGGDKSDIRIPGIEKEHAEKIKQLLMGKIIKEKQDEN